MFAAGCSHYLLLLMSPIYRYEFKSSALVFIGVKRLDVSTMLTDQEEYSSYQAIHPRYNPESSDSNASTLTATLLEWQPGNVKRRGDDTKALR